MRRSMCVMAGALAVLSAGCQTNRFPMPKVIAERCPGVTGLIAQDLKVKYDIDSGRSIAVNLSAAAEADVAKFKQLGGKVDGEAKLGTTLKGSVDINASVPTDFYLQDQNFGGTVCWLDWVLLNDAKMTPAARDSYEQARLKLVNLRVDYEAVLTGLKKN